jgi:hypothetical protein
MYAMGVGRTCVPIIGWKLRLSRKDGRVEEREWGWRGAATRGEEDIGAGAKNPDTFDAVCTALHAPAQECVTRYTV